MNQLRVLDENLEIFTDNKETAKELQQSLSCFEPGYEHQTMYRCGKWDGKRKFYEVQPMQSGWYFKTSLGFLNRVQKLLDIKEEFIKLEQPDPMEFLKEIIPTLPFTPYKHQLKLFLGMVNNTNHISIAATGSGKSLAVYLLLMYFRSFKEPKTIILLVPTIMLVQQMFNDFKEYNASDEFMQSIQQIGGEFTNKEVKKPVVISTWQSAQKSDLSSFNIAITDEAHTAKADILDSILKNNNFQRRLGLTGSYPIIEIDALILESNFGEPVRYINARNMIDMNLATNVSIVSMYLNYPKVPKSQIKNYQAEVKFMKEHQGRQKFINNLLLGLKGVTVGLYAHTEHGVTTWENLTGIKLSTRIKKSFELQKEQGHGGVFFLSGNTNPKIREKIRVYLNTPEAENAKVIAQFSIMSTGINIKRLKNLVYLSNTKSYTATLQSIGRVLRLHEDKTHAYVFDLVDCMSGSRTQKNYLQEHYWNRVSYYNQEGFDILEKEITLKNN